jgi:Fe-Mn family superoxide dismutase
MGTLSRRNFIFASSGAAAGTFVASGFVNAGETHSGDTNTGESNEQSSSGLVTGRQKPLRYKSIPGFLSAKQLAPHYTAHYGGALRGYGKADQELQTSVSAGAAMESNAYANIQRARTSKGNSVLLHELYFDGMTPQPTAPNPELTQAITRRFGSLNNWAADFQMSATAAKGWAMLAYHPINGHLYNVISDEHANGALWMATPLVVIDMYEHAFYVDYQNRKSDYIHQFMEHIDWQAVNHRYDSLR